MRHASPIRRSGSLLVCVLVCLGIATSIMLTTVNSSLRARRQITREMQMEQTRWLVDAGLTRARNQLHTDRDYAGESWEVTPPLADHQTATIEVTVIDGDSPDDQRRLTVTGVIRGHDPGSQPTRHTIALLVERDALGSNQTNSSLETDPDPRGE